MYSLCGGIISGTTPVLTGGVGLLFPFKQLCIQHSHMTSLLPGIPSLKLPGLVVSNHEFVLNFFFSMKKLLLAVTLVLLGK